MNAALYATYNQQAVNHAAQQLMSGQLPQNPVMPPVQKKKVFAKLTPSERGFYSNLLTKADKKGVDKIQGAQAVAFLKCSGLQKETLKRIWQLAAYEDPKHLNKQQFYVALKLIAYAQNKMDVSIESVITNLPVDLPKFNFGGLNDSTLQAVVKNSVEQAPKINVEELPDLDSINPMNFGGSSFIAQKPQQQQQNQQQQQPQFSKNAARSSPYFISSQQLKKYKRIYQNFDKDKKGYLSSAQAKQIFQKTGLSNQILKKVWTMVDFMDRGIIDNFAFIMSMHLLHRCKNGQDLPNSIPQQMWASFGQAGVIYRFQLESVNAMKQAQEQQQRKKKVATSAPQNINLLNDSVLQQEPKLKQEIKINDNFGNLIEDTGVNLSSGDNSQNQNKRFNFELGDQNMSGQTSLSIPPSSQNSNFLASSPRQPLSQGEQLQEAKVSDPFDNLQNQQESILSTPAVPIQASKPISIVSPPPQQSSSDYSYGVKNLNKALENQIQFLQNQTAANNQIIRGVQTEVQRIQDYDAKMKGYQENFAQMQVIQQDRRNIQSEIVKKQVAIAQASINEQVVAQNSYQKSYDDNRSNGGYSRKQSNYDDYSQKGYYGGGNSYNYNTTAQNSNWGNEKSSYQQSYSNNQMGWNDGDYKWEDQANMNSGDSNTNQVNGDDYNLKKNQDIYQQQQQQSQYRQQNYQQQQNLPIQQQNQQQCQQPQQQDYSNQNFNEWGQGNFENSQNQLHRGSTVSKGWRFQVYKQDMKQDENRYNQYQGYQNQQNFQQDAFSNNNTGNEGFDMKFESNFNDTGSNNQNTGGGEFKFDWGGDQGQDAAANKKENENQDFGGGWVDFQTNTQNQSSNQNNNGFGNDGGMNFDFN